MAKCKLKLVLFIITGVALFAVVAPSVSLAQEQTRMVDGITIKPGYPLQGEGAVLMKNLQLSRATELFLWSLPLNQSYAGRDAMFKASGGGMMDVTYIGGFADHSKKLSTLNNETVYAMVHMDLHDGPVVYEQPVMDQKGYMFGSIIDVWQVALSDVGIPQVTPDQGKGGKYLILPPGYKGDVPKGYLPIQSTSYQVRLGLRSVMLEGATIADAIERVKRVKVYPLSDPSRKQNYIDVLGKPVDAEVDKGIGAFRRIHDYLSSEPIQEKDKYLIGMLQTLGIEKGKPFPADAATLALLQSAADLGWMTAKQNMTEAWPASPLDGWLALGLVESWNPNYTTGDLIQVDGRAAYFALAIWPPKNMGNSTFYGITFSDTDNTPLQPGVHYKLHLPAKVPAKSFWSVILYDAEAAAMIANPQKKYAISSLNKALKYNGDGSIDVYFGPEAPKGLENNWIPTTKNDFFAGIRFYGPDWERLGKSWSVTRPERISQP